ncbi:MAG TPA: homocysteine S-methyltransferase family protein [Streptosporangiaceae bacterium]|nr:homocysteine S-methyltransferase family protein [Streptosporangiaceae bacterium]
MGTTLDVVGRLAAGDVVIVDGGTGSQLQAEGVPMDDLAWSARANLEHPGAVQRVHEEYIRAGAEVVIANTYAANRAALEPAGLGSNVAEVNRAAMRAALDARRAAASRPVAVAGSISSFSAAVMAAPPADTSTPGLAEFREQAELLAEAGADLIALEMIGGRGYGTAAVQAAMETGLPVWLGVSPFREPDGTLGMQPEYGDGDTLEQLVSALATPGLAAITVMRAQPEVTMDAIDIVRRHYAGPIGVYAETGEWTPPNWEFTGLSPSQYLAEATTWAGCGAQLIGGCCGVGPEHIALLASSLGRTTQ